MASSQDAWYLSLLGLAENFRTSNPPNIKSCIQCLQAVFNFKPPPRVEARTHLQLGNILLTHTKNIDLARSHLEQAVSWFFLNIFCSRISGSTLILLLLSRFPPVFLIFLIILTVSFSYTASPISNLTLLIIHQMNLSGSLCESRR